MKKNQKGFALAISLILMIILTFLGFNIANRGKLTSQITKTSVRYEAVTAVAEAEMYRLMNALVRTEDYVERNNNTIIVNDSDGPRVTMVWDSKKLAEAFDSEGMPVFYNFRHKGREGAETVSGWESGIVNDYPSQDVGSAIRTRGFIQEMLSRQISSEVENTQIEVQYLFTVKAYYVQEPKSDAKNDIERETIVIQSVFRRQFSL